MSYPKSYDITYSAIAAANYRPNDTFTYVWVFDDLTTLSGATVTKQWSTTGDHTATVTATDVQVGASLSVSKTITVDLFDWHIYASLPNYLISSPSAQIDTNTVMSIGGGTYTGNVFKYCYLLSGGVWVRTGDLNVGRCNNGGNAFHQVIFPKLPNGKVLAAGSTNSYSIPDGKTCELYDPDTGIWALTGSMTASRGYGCHPVVLNDGRVMVFGGADYGAGTYGYAEFYDPATEWTKGPVSPANGTPSGASALDPCVVKLQDGRVLYICPWAVTDAEKIVIFDPTTDTWEDLVSSFPGTIDTTGWFYGMEAILGQDGDVYVFGYRTGSHTKSRCFKIEISTNSLIEIAECPYDLTNAAPFLSAASLIVLYSAGNGATVYDTVNNTWGLHSTFVQTGIISLNYSKRYLGFGTVGGKPVLWGSPGQPDAPYTNVEMFYGSQV